MDKRGNRYTLDIGSRRHQLNLKLSASSKHSSWFSALLEGEELVIVGKGKPYDDYFQVYFPGLSERLSRVDNVCNGKSFTLK